jgi:hypothetical protein
LLSAIVLGIPLIIGFIAGYGVREMISHARRKRRRGRTKDVARWFQN